MVVGIVGAGIGGLTTAIALQHAGIQVKLFERAPKIEAIGAGISLAPNAMEIFRKLGFFEEVVAKGMPWEFFQITDERFTTLQQLTPRFYKNSESIGISIGRMELHHLLYSKIAPQQIYLDHEFQNFEMNDNQVTIHFTHQASQSVDLLIGADGIKSKVRQQLFPHSTLRSAHQYCWRGIKTSPPPKQNKSLEAWGAGCRFGITHIGNGLDYWYVVADGDELPKDWNHQHIIDQISNFDKNTQSIICETPLKDILLHPIMELKPLKKWYRGPVVLMGDAAHAMTPNMGQGACQAIIDAYILGETIAAGKTFKEYERKRKPIVSRIVWMSSLIGRVGQWKNPIMMKSRNMLMRISQPLMKWVRI